MPSSGPRRLLGRASVLASLCLAVPALAAPRAGADDAPQGARPDPRTRDGVLRVVEELRAEASRIRGLAWKRDVPADLLTREQLRRHIEAMIEEDLKPEEYARDVKINRRMGLLAADEDPIDLTKRFLEQAIAGYYDSKTKRLYLIDGVSVEAQRPTILHELIHALEDQYIDLEARRTAAAADSDATFAMKCTTEGSAELARKRYERAHPDVARRSREEQTRPADEAQLAKTVQATPAFLLVPTILNYELGPALIARLVGRDYPGGMARIYAGDAPTTGEQFLHPGRFASGNRDLPRAIAWPAGLAEAAGRDWKGLDVQGYGELDFALWMNHWLGRNHGRLGRESAEAGRPWNRRTEAAAEGWDGMKIQVLERSGVPTGVALASAWDTHRDAREAGDALEDALRAQFESTFEASPWRDAEGEGGRVLDFSDRLGAGRILVRDDVVLLLDGFPGETLGAVWARLAEARFARDPKDTWTAANNVDPVAIATWRSGDVGWQLPDEMWVADETPGSFTRGDLSFRLAVEKMPPQAAFLKYLAEAKARSPGAEIDLSSITEISVGGKEAARLNYDDPATGLGHALILVEWEDVTVVMRASAPKASSVEAARDLDEALDAIVWKDR